MNRNLTCIPESVRRLAKKPKTAILLSVLLSVSACKQSEFSAADKANTRQADANGSAGGAAGDQGDNNILGQDGGADTATTGQDGVRDHINGLDGAGPTSSDPTVTVESDLGGLDGSDTGTDPDSDSIPNSKGMLRITFTCTGPSSLGTNLPPVTIEGSGEADSVRFRGQFCIEQGETVAPSALVFAVDTSDSMDSADPSCNRRTAIQNFLQAAKGVAGANSDTIQVGFVTFGNTATSYPLTSIDDAIAFAQGEELCTNFGSTNYEQAFRLATDVMATAAVKNRALYILSDGLPTIWGDKTRVDAFAAEQRDLLFAGKPQEREAKAQEALREGRAKGIEASASFLTANPEAVINAIFLSKDTDKAEGEEYLLQITGSANRVKVVEDSAGFIQEIDKFDNPLLRFSTRDLQGSVSSINGQVAFTKMTPLRADGSQWEFSMEPVPLQATLTISVKLQLGANKYSTLERTLKFEP